MVTVWSSPWERCRISPPWLRHLLCSHPELHAVPARVRTSSAINVAANVPPSKLTFASFFTNAETRSSLAC